MSATSLATAPSSKDPDRSAIKVTTGPSSPGSSQTGVKRPPAALASPTVTSTLVHAKKPHPILGRGVKPVFVLADQVFPPAVLALDGGRCLAIVCIEDGLLNDIVDLFTE